MGALPFGYPSSGPFYVSPSGSDTVGDGSSGNPWATPGKAASFIRTNNLNQVLRSDMIVNIATGDYGPGAFSAMTQLDSGSNGFRVVYQASGAPGSARFWGGVLVTGWTQVSGSIYKAPIPGGANPYTLYENGVRARTCRLPKYVPDVNFPMANAPYFSSVSNGSSWDQLQYNPVDFDPTAYPLADMQTVVWCGGQRCWMTDTHTTVAVDTTNHLVTFGERGKMYSYNTGPSRYYVQGVQALLSQAGEFYIDRSGGFIYYWAVNGPAPSQQIVCPTTTTILSVQGANGLTRDQNGVQFKASGLQFKGLKFQYTDFLQTYRMGYPTNLGGGLQGPPGFPDPIFAYWLTMPNARTGAVNVQNFDDITFDSCWTTNSGTNGMYFSGFGSRLAVLNSLVEHSGMTAIQQQGGQPQLGDHIGGSVFTDNWLRFMGELAGHSTGLHLLNTGNNTATNCSFTDGVRHGVWISGGSETYDTYLQVYTRNNLIDHCDFRRLCQDSGDTAALYMEAFVAAVTPYNTNTFNQIIIDSIAACASMLDYQPQGVFTDDVTDGQVFQNVQVTNCQGGQFRSAGDTDANTHTLTNTSFKADGTANGSFNAGLMDTANIGTTSAFPYP